MICRVFRTVVYWVGLRAAIASCTSRTVPGPWFQRTVSISSSASVGRGGPVVIYEEHTTILFVVQAAREIIGGLDPQHGCGRDELLHFLHHRFVIRQITSDQSVFRDRKA